MSENTIKVISYVISFIMGIVVAIILGLSQNSLLGTNIVYGFFTTLVVQYLSDILIIQPRERRNFFDSINKKLDNIIWHAALFTENHSMEKSLAPLSKPGFGKAKWLVAKFISKKLSHHFDVGAIIHHIDPLEYSEFARTLIKECCQSINLTVIFEPYKWFQAILEKPPKPHILEQILNGKQVSIEFFPHICELRKNQQANKKRLVLLDDKEWQKMLQGGLYDSTAVTPEQAINCLYEFIRLNNEANSELRFANINSFPVSYSSIFSIIRNCDFGIYERKVIVTWKITNDEYGSLELETEESKVRQYSELFDYNKPEYGQIYFTSNVLKHHG